MSNKRYQTSRYFRGGLRYRIVCESLPIMYFSNPELHWIETATPAASGRENVPSWFTAANLPYSASHSGTLPIVGLCQKSPAYSEAPQVAAYRISFKNALLVSKHAQCEMCLIDVRKCMSTLQNLTPGSKSRPQREPSEVADAEEERDDGEEGPRSEVNNSE